MSTTNLVVVAAGFGKCADAHVVGPVVEEPGSVAGLEACAAVLATRGRESRTAWGAASVAALEIGDIVGGEEDVEGEPGNGGAFAIVALKAVDQAAGIEIGCAASEDHSERTCVGSAVDANAGLAADPGVADPAAVVKVDFGGTCEHSAVVAAGIGLDASVEGLDTAVYVIHHRWNWLHVSGRSLCLYLRRAEG